MAAPLPLVKILLERGVNIRLPQSVDIADDIDPDCIAPGVVIHAGTRLNGKRTCIAPGCIIGAEGPTTISNCQLGIGVHLKGGTFDGATFLDGVVVGPGAHIRPGTLLEEQASCAHGVGLKQTLFMPYVTTGSLINLCDCMVAGGTGPKDHSEIGSSFVHFNFSPQQEKATPSMMGDVPRGVLLNQRPVFMGGQGGIVGPCTIEYGTVVPAGTICRRDIQEPDQLIFNQSDRQIANKPFDARIFGNIEHKLYNNFRYAANLHALHAWYAVFRTPVMARSRWTKMVCSAAIDQLHHMMRERIKQLGRLAEKCAMSIAIAQNKQGADLPEKPFALQRRFADRWLDTAANLHLPDGAPTDTAAATIAQIAATTEPTTYTAIIHALNDRQSAQITAWLQGIVTQHIQHWCHTFELHSQES